MYTFACPTMRFLVIRTKCRVKKSLCSNKSNSYNKWNEYSNQSKLYHSNNQCIITPMDTLCNNLPEKVLQRLEELFSKKELEKVLQSMQIKRLASFRANSLKTTSDVLEQNLKKQNFAIERVSWYKDAFILKNKSIRELTETETYKQGHLYIQNLSSMIPALVLNPQQNDYILDIAAAPGSKTTQLAALMQNSGDIVANDISPKRLYRLKDNLSQTGTTNTRILSLRGESFWKRYPELFDKTLVDVPCSMEGRITCADPKTYQDWSTKKIKQLAKLQKYLLRSAISATKVGGTIV